MVQLDPSIPTKKKKKKKKGLEKSTKKKKKYASMKKIAVKSTPKTKLQKAPHTQSQSEADQTSEASTAQLPNDQQLNPTNTLNTSTGYYGILLETKRVETLCRTFALQNRDLLRMRRLFNSEDIFKTGAITINEFFHLIEESKRTLTLGIFAYVGLDKDIKQLKFDEFVLCIVTFATMTRVEMLQYVFSLFNQDGTGVMDSQELQELCGNLKNDGFFFKNNVDVAQNKLASPGGFAHVRHGGHIHTNGGDDDGLVDFNDLTEGSAHFSAAFYPILQIQRNIQNATLGESRWVHICTKKEFIDSVVTYMRTHQGHLPKLTRYQHVTATVWRAIAVLSRGLVGKSSMYFLREAAVKKFEAEVILHQELESERIAKSHEQTNNELS